jgi:hypothetical protein
MILGAIERAINVGGPRGRRQVFSYRSLRRKPEVKDQFSAQIA